MVIEAGVAAGYLVAWAARKARRAGGRLDAEVDTAIDTGLDKLHEVVAAKLGAHPVIDDLIDETGDGHGTVSELTRQRMELEVTAAAHKDDRFGHVLAGLITQVRAAEQAAGTAVTAGLAARVFTGPAHARADGGGIAFGQVAGNVHIGRGGGESPDPSEPGRSSR